MHGVIITAVTLGLLCSYSKEFVASSGSGCRQQPPQKATNVEDIIDPTVELLLRLDLPDMAVITDNGKREARIKISQRNYMLKMEIVYYQPNTTGSHQPLTDIWLQLKSSIILILGHERFQRKSLTEMSKVADRVGRLSPLVLDTRWLVLVSTSVLVAAKGIASLPLNHVALLVSDSEQPRWIRTLLWTSNGRHLADVSERDVTSSSLFPNSDVGLSGIHLRVGINLWYPYVIATTRDDGSLEYTGFCMDILKYLAEFHNFSYEMVVPPDGEWGDYRDGNWTGLVGLIDRREVDMVVASIAYTAERSVVVDSTGPYEYVYCRAVVKQEDVGLRAWDVFLKPFQWQWTGSAARVLIASWCLLGLLLTSCYTCRLTSLLVLVTNPSPFTSLAEMVRSDGFRWGMIGGTALTQRLRESNDSVFRAVYRGLLNFAQDDPDVFSLDVDVHMKNVLSGHYAFINVADSPTMLKERDNLKLIPLPELGVYPYSILTPKESPLPRKLDKALLRMQDTGVLAYLHKQWVPEEKGERDKRSSQTVITLTMLQGPLYVAAGGLILAAVVIVFERSLAGRRKGREQSCRHD
ncbi:hypothetical protein BaRGS_00032608 [Batillaria attramentaria]|uniref:Uncharacterized protein n=1 Tax=Batillaria attramentaria TaxID=370345 RepID=A0ABD0JN17_9CAEN